MNMLSNSPDYHLLPKEAYTSQEWFDQEQDRIFSRTWRFAGFRNDLCEPGQYKSVNAGNHNIFVVMGKDRRLRAFHNICRHRGTRLIRAVGKTSKALTCPYHDWTYDLEGNLISVPDEEKEFPDGINKKCLGLKVASVDIWREMIFVHPDPNAQSVNDWFGPMDEKLSAQDVRSFEELQVPKSRHHIKANWKIVVENYIDIYHLSHLHSNTLRQYDHASSEHAWVGPHYSFKEPLSDFYAEGLKKHIPGKIAMPMDKLAAYVPMLWPGFGLAENELGQGVFLITPLAPDETQVDLRFRMPPISNIKLFFQYLRWLSFKKKHLGGKFSISDGFSKDDPMVGGDFMAEDIYACEMQQAAMKSSEFEVGPASKGESPLLGHQKVVLEWMENKI